MRKAHRKRPFWLTTVLIPGTMSFACPAQAEEKPMTLRLESEAFSEGGAIPRKYTCEGEDISPPLAWAGIPDGAKSLVLIADDPDAPDPKAPRMTWVHWVLYNIPADAGGLAEGVKSPAGGDDERRQRLEASGLWRPVPAGWAPPLFLQALCPRYDAPRPEPPQQGGGRGGDARSHSCANRAHRHL